MEATSARSSARSRGGVEAPLCGSSGPDAIWPSDPIPPTPPANRTAAETRIATGAMSDAPVAPAALLSHVEASPTVQW
jgi:hypothetical protein